VISLPQAGVSWPGRGECGSCNVCCDAIGVPDLGKPFYARCPHLIPNSAGGGCGIYHTRPGRCREYRCAFHMGILGEKEDRRPDHCGVLFQIEPHNGKWYLGMFEVIPGAANTEKARYLRDMILKSKLVRHLNFGSPPVRLIPYGADVPVEYAIDPAYDWKSPDDPGIMKIEGASLVFAGKCRELLMPHKTATDAQASTAPPDSDLAPDHEA
jgi:Fe-S-cluster containining protein